MEMENEEEKAMEMENEEDGVKEGKHDLNPRCSGRKPEMQPRDHGAQSKHDGA